MKQFFRYTIYPAVMFSAGLLLITGMQAGYDFYLATAPVITGFGIFILVLERWLPHEKDWVQGKHDSSLDLTYYAINYIIKLAAQYLFIALAANFQFLSWFPTRLPFWLQVLFALTLIDFFLFFVRWQSHNYLFLWRLHAIHHSSVRLYFLNGEKRHALHQILEGSPGILICLFIGVPQPVVVTALAILTINMFMQHTNLDYRAGILKKFFCVAELHRWHHRADYKEAQVNYGAWLTVWDRLFGTAYDEPRMQTDLGCIGIAEERNFPNTYWKQFLYPFSKKLQQKARTTLLIGALVSAISISYAQSTADHIVGNWQLHDGSLRIQVYKETGAYHGKIIWVKALNQQDDVGKKVLWNLAYNSADKEWANGKIQLPNMNHSVDCYIRLEGNNVATVTGYHGLRWLGKTRTLIRI